MQHRSFAKSISDSSHNKAQASTGGSHPSSAPHPRFEELARVFNTSVVSSQAKAKRDFSSELFALTDSSAFKAILNAVQQLARVQGISEKQAAEQVIQTFRRLDEIWGEYMFHEGLDRLRSAQPQKK